MNIVQVISHYVPAYAFGGPLHVAHELSKSFISLGHNVSVCTTNLKNHQETLDVPTSEPVDQDGVSVFYEETQFSKYWGFSVPLIFRIRNEIKEADIVLIHAHFQFSNLISAYLCRLYNVPYIIFPHNSIRKRALEGGNSLLKRMYLKFLEKNNFKNAEFIAFNAEEELEDSLFKENGRVIPNGISEENFRLKFEECDFRKKYGISEHTICYSFLGRLDIDQKAVDKIVKAFAKIREKNPNNVHLVLAGPSEGNDGIKIKKLVTSLGIESSVTFTGLVGWKEKLCLFRESDVFVLPSNYEGLSISLLEAMYMKLPVVVSKNVGLHKDITKKKCGVVVDTKAKDIVRGMECMFNSQFRIEAGKNARKLILENHKWEKIANDLIETISAN